MAENNTSDSRPSGAVDYEIICQSVGHLYLESALGNKRMESKYSSLVENLTQQVEQLVGENEVLRQKFSEKTKNESG